VQEISNSLLIIRPQTLHWKVGIQKERNGVIKKVVGYCQQASADM
jgi:hypothetical protein